MPTPPQASAQTLPSLVAGPQVQDIQNALAAWANAVVPGVPVIWLDQNGTRPPKPYVSLKLVGPTKVTGIDWPANGGEGTAGSRRYTVTVEAYTEAPNGSTIIDAAQLISDLIGSLDDQGLSDTLSEAGIGVGVTHAPNDLSTALDTKIERRVAFDWEANVIVTRANSQNYTIESVTAPAVTFS